MSHASHEHDSHSPAHYTKIAAILIGLAFISYVGPWIGIQAITLITAFGIAVVKAFLVIKHFMHLTIERKYVGYFLLISVAFVVLFFAGTAADVLNHRGRNWENVAAQREVIRAEEQHAAAAHDGHGGHDVEEAPRVRVGSVATQ